MTVTGQKNHYNVKLKGYGVSINLKDNRLCLKGGRDPFTGEQEIEEWFVSQIPYERIVISGKGYLSTEALKLLTDHNINIILTDTYGNLVTAMHRVMSSPTATNYRIAQYDTFRNTEKVAYLQRQLLKNKLESQINFLKSLQRPEVQSVIDGLAVYATKIENARDKRDLLTIESRAGHIYFRNYAKLFDSKYGFYFQTRRHKTHCKTIISRRYVDRMAEKVVTSIIIFEMKYENNKYVNRSITISRNLPLRNSCHIAFSEPQDYNL